MERDDVERLVRVEQGLQVVRDDLHEHRVRSDERHRELVSLIETTRFRWSRAASPEVIKVLAYVVLSLAGAAGAASALFK